MAAVFNFLLQNFALLSILLLFPMSFLFFLDQLFATFNSLLCILQFALFCLVFCITIVVFFPLETKPLPLRIIIFPLQTPFLPCAYLLPTYYYYDYQLIVGRLPVILYSVKEWTVQLQSCLLLVVTQLELQQQLARFMDSWLYTSSSQLNPVKRLVIQLQTGLKLSIG